MVLNGIHFQVSGSIYSIVVQSTGSHGELPSPMSVSVHGVTDQHPGSSTCVLYNIDSITNGIKSDNLQSQSVSCPLLKYKQVKLCLEKLCLEMSYENITVQKKCGEHSRRRGEKSTVYYWHPPLVGIC